MSASGESASRRKLPIGIEQAFTLVELEAGDEPGFGQGEGSGEEIVVHNEVEPHHTLKSSQCTMAAVRFQNQ